MMKQVKLSVDFANITGKIKPMHGVGQPPMVGVNDSMFSYLTRAGIPYSCLHMEKTPIRSRARHLKITP